MKIQKINTFPQIKFSANPKSDDFGNEILGFDNSYQVRGALRDHMYANLLGYIPHYEVKHVDFARTLDDVYITNYRDIGNSSRCGASLAHDIDYLDLLRKTGIYKVIDLIGYRNLEQNCLDRGIDYYKYPVDYDYLKNPIFVDDKTLLAKRTLELSKKGITKKDLDEELEHYKKMISVQRGIFVENFSDLIKEMNSGHLYIACDLGEIRTPLILNLNTLFNSQWQGQKLLPKDRMNDCKICNMLNNLTPADKELLKFTDKQQKFVEDYLSDTRVNLTH